MFLLIILLSFTHSEDIKKAFIEFYNTDIPDGHYYSEIVTENGKIYSGVREAQNNQISWHNMTTEEYVTEYNQISFKVYDESETETDRVCNHVIYFKDEGTFECRPTTDTNLTYFISYSKSASSYTKIGLLLLILPIFAII